MTTAIDNHFTNAGDDLEPEMEFDDANALPEEPKKKSGNGSTIAIIGIAALAISAAGYVAMKRLSGGQADQQVLADVAPVEQQMAPPIAEEPLVPGGTATDGVVASQVAPAEFASSVPVVPTAPAAVSPVPPVQLDAAPAGPTGMNAPAAPQPVQPPVTNQPVAPAVSQSPAPAQSATPAQAVAANQGNDAEAAKLVVRLGEAKQQISRLEGEVNKLRKELAAARQSAPKPSVTRSAASPSPAKAAPTKTAAKPAAKPAEKTTAQAKQAETKPAESTTGRNDFRIYAMRDGQAWVQDLKTRETIPAAPGSMLPDGSKVTKVNEASGVISTTAGEIRYTSLNRAH